MVGWSFTAGGVTHAFHYSNGAMTDLGALGDVASFAYGINDNGQVVGTAHTASNTTYPFLCSGGSLLELNTLLPSGSGWTSLSNATAINDLGQITGVGFINGQAHVFLMTPVADNAVPEPTTLVLLGLGLAGLGFSHRKRARASVSAAPAAAPVHRQVREPAGARRRQRPAGIRPC